MLSAPILRLQTPLVKDIFHEIVFQSQRSSGPGGQNVNKTNSSVQLRWSFLESAVLSEDQKKRIAEKLQKWISKENIILIRSDVHRDQDQNKREVVTRLQTILNEGFHVPKKRKATKPTFSSKKKKEASKKIRSEVKKGRQAKWT